ncbi:hypothetical protein SNE40_005244 [Patella caerulea]
MDGYTTKEALSTLYQELQAEVTLHQKLESRNKLKYLSGLDHRNVTSTYNWTSLLAISISICLLGIAYAYDNDSSSLLDVNWWLVEAVVLFLSVVVNIMFIISDNNKNRFEYIRLHQLALDRIKEYVDQHHWHNSSYPNLHSPISPCISLQWTLRDGQIVNLPSVLLVKGDIILMRCGQNSPGKCKQIDPTVDGEDIVLYGGDVYNPLDSDIPEYVTSPIGRHPVETTKFIMLDTPYIENLRLTLEDKSKHPDSMIENERHLISSIWLQRIIIPITMVVMLICNILRWQFLGVHMGHWSETVLVLLVHACLPLLPVVFPVMWCLLNAYGQARIHGAFQVAKNIKQKLSDSFDSTSTISIEEARVDLPWADVFSWFLSIIFNKAPVVTSKTNILFTLGSVTSFCCVDKKGILSWPSPSPEKVFFLAPNPTVKEETKVSAYNDSVFEDIPEDEEVAVKKISDQKPAITGNVMPSHIEVLGISQDPKNVCVLHFDDPNWKTHVNSLKPLGLNILLNLCNVNTVDWYAKFSGHVACSALKKKETVAVINRRCLCYLAREIGFTSNVVDGFIHDKVLGMYRQVPAEETAKEKQHRAASHIQHQIPMPHLVSVVVKDKISGLSQLMTQGTADILLDCCTEYWNGRDLCPVTENDRKKILDFYHRNTQGAYCTAFAYRPISQKIACHLEEVYVELPETSMKTSTSLKFRSTGISDGDSGTETDCVFSGNRSFSVDSLMESESIISVNTATDCYDTQQNQIFIGMITLQYQARQDFVQLIDKLESACIRFVHFSKENELRSRVFSEKMGLEAGWNCHISLLSNSSEKLDSNTSGSDYHTDTPQKPSRRTSQHSVDGCHTRTSDTKSPNAQDLNLFPNARSYSAPSLINIDSSQVKFLDQPSDIVSRSPSGTIASDSHENDVLLCDPDGWQSSDEDEGNEYQSDSRYTSSYVTENTEDSLTGALDNRAKLPRGIENIRPHLKNIDNVPLLVNLFTDCTVETTKEMVKIMQENGEIVLCVGSALNMHNTPLFLQADCCLAVEPLHPTSCTQQPIPCDLWSDDEPTPTQIACALITIPCPLAFKSNDNFSLIHLIAEARHHIFGMRNCFYLMLCYHLSLTLCQVVASIFLLPPLLSARHLMWLLLIVTPLLGFTMMGNPVDPRIMNLATRKNINHINLNMVLQFLLQFTLRFVPSMIISLFCFTMILNSYSENILDMSFNVYNFKSFPSNHTIKTWYDKYSGGLVLAQNIMFFLQVLYFACISMSFVHWTDHLWKKPPFTNKLWLVITPSLLLLQVIVCCVDVLIHNRNVKHPLPLSDVHPVVWVVGFIWVFVIITINELVKRREIKLAVRHQKRARLDFDTKLGMNSPF